MFSTINPEFQRIVRQEFTAGKLGVIGLLLVIIFGVTIGSGFMDEPETPNILFVIGSLLILVVGPITSVNNFVADINQGIWLFQRMSAYPLLSRALVKSLVSGGSFPLLGLIICISSIVIEPLRPLMLTHRLFNVLISSFGIHALSNAIVLLLARKQKTINKSLPNSISVFLGMIVAIPSIGNLSGGIENDMSLLWYGLEFKASYFVTFSLVLYAIWAFSGFLEALKSEFLEPSFKWYWPCFVVFNSLFILGIRPAGANANIAEFINPTPTINLIYLTGITLTSALVSFQSPEFWRKWLIHPNFESLPYWVFPFVLALSQSFWISYISEPSPVFVATGISKIVDFPYYTLAMVRDVGVFLVCALILPPGKAEFRGILFFLIFNFLVPILTGFENMSYSNPTLSQVGKGFLIVEAVLVVIFVVYFAIDKVLKPNDFARS